MSATTSRRTGLGAALCLVAAAALAPAAARAASPPGTGSPAPPLRGTSFSSEPFDLSAWHGRVVVLNFWASWCEPCRAEMPLLDALQRDYRDRGVVVLGLSADDRHDRKQALQAAHALGYMTGMLAETTANGFGAPRALPLTYIIDDTGMVTAVLQANRGPLSAAELRTALEQALGHAPVFTSPAP